MREPLKAAIADGAFLMVATILIVKISTHSVKRLEQPINQCSAYESRCPPYTGNGFAFYSLWIKIARRNTVFSGSRPFSF